MVIQYATNITKVSFSSGQLDEKLEATPQLFREILDYYPKGDGQFKFHLNWGPYYEGTWEPRNNVKKEGIPAYFAWMHREM